MLFPIVQNVFYSILQLFIRLHKPFVKLLRPEMKLVMRSLTEIFFIEL
jgi:hypothetical protein